MINDQNTLDLDLSDEPMIDTSKELQSAVDITNTKVKNKKTKKY